MDWCGADGSRGCRAGWGRTVVLASYISSTFRSEYSTAKALGDSSIRIAEGGRVLTEDQRVLLTQDQHAAEVLTEDQRMVGRLGAFLTWVLILVHRVLILVQGMLTERQQGC